jgi:hypothetical protein
MKIAVPIQKVDAAKREVWGTIAVEQVDKSGEIFDYHGSKPFFIEWSDQKKAESFGKSKGNVREMHQLIAVGKLVDIQFDDATKSISVGAKIVDDLAWEKCEAGVYTGFSIGGKLVGKKQYDQQAGGTRYTVKPLEVSVVDDPCIPDATFEYVKANNEIEVRKFAITKAMIDVADMAQCLSCLNQIRGYLENEAEYEGDGSEMPEALRAWIEQGVALLVELAAEEGGELTNEKIAKIGAVLSKKNRGMLSKVKEEAEKVAQAISQLLASTETKINHGDNAMNQEEINKAVGAEVQKRMEAATDDIITKVANAFKAQIAESLKDVAKSADIAKLSGEMAEVKKSSDEALELATETANTILKLTQEPEEPKVAAGTHVVSKVTDAKAGTEGTVAKKEDMTARDAIKDSFTRPIVR